MSADDIELRYGKHTVVASGNTVTIDGKDTFDLTAVNEVAFDTYPLHINGTYQGTYFTLEFRQDKRFRSANFKTDHSDKTLAEYRGPWEAIANRIYAITIPRIATEIAARVRAGEKVSLGTMGGDKVELTTEGVKKGGLFTKPVPWSQVSRAGLDGRKINILGRTAPDAEDKVIGGVPVGFRNSYALPTVVELLKV